MGKNIGDDAHRIRGRIDVGVAHHEFLQNIVLNGARQLGLRHALFLGGDDVERQHGQDRAIHGHGHAHLVERDAREQGAHVENGIDGDASHAHVAGDARVVAVVAAMGGEIEGHGEALLARREIAAIEGVGILGRREARVLPHRPRLIDIHGRIGTTHIGRGAGERINEVQTGDVGGAIGGLDRDFLGRDPRGAAKARQGRAGNL